MLVGELRVRARSSVHTFLLVAGEGGGVVGVGCREWSVFSRLKGCVGLV